MEKTSLTDLADTLVADARTASSGRVSHTLHGGQESVMRQTLLALAAGRELGEHHGPPEATLQVLQGRVRLVAGEESLDLGAGEHALIPAERHSLHADEDAVVLLTTGLHEGR
jgi:quercetin dioxygenase-like cupin family protein